MPKFKDNFAKEIDKIYNEMENMFQNFIKANRPMVVTKTRKWVPETDLVETEDEYIIVVDLPYVNPKDIEIIYKLGYITIRGIRRNYCNFEIKRYHKMEIDFGHFERTIEIPGPIDNKNVLTKYKEGFLEIRLKKLVERRGREIRIKIE